MTQRKVAFVHTSPAAIGPLMQFYSEAAPEMEITNLLDDGILRLLAAQAHDDGRQRFAQMIEAGRDVYQAELAMITCSAVPKQTIAQLRETFAVPILKIDHPMARQAAQSGGRVGVAVTFAPTLEPTCRLLMETAAELGTSIDLVPEVVPGAYQALLSNDMQTHDDLLLAAIKRLEQQTVSTIVLAQVSMARILPRAQNQTSVPVLSSLHTSLDAIRDGLQKIG